MLCHLITTEFCLLPLQWSLMPWVPLLLNLVNLLGLFCVSTSWHVMLFAGKCIYMIRLETDCREGTCSQSRTDGNQNDNPGGEFISAVITNFLELINEI